MGAPGDTDGSQKIAHNGIHHNEDGQTGQDYHWQQAITQNAGRLVDVHSTLAHQVHQHVDSKASNHAYSIDVPKVDFPCLRIGHGWRGEEKEQSEQSK